MRIRVSDVVVQFRFFNQFYLRGMAIDEATGEFPKSLQVTLPNGGALPIDQAALSSDPAAQRQFGFPETRHLSFKVNLFDAGNSLVNDYGVELEGRNIWTYRSALKGLAGSPLLGKAGAIGNQFGGKQIVCIYAEGGAVSEMLQRISILQPEFFAKSFNSSVCISLIPVSKLAENKDNFLKQERQTVVLIEERVFNEALRISPAMFITSKTLVLSRKLRMNDYFGGLPNVIAYLMHLETEKLPLTPSVLMTIFSCLSGYGDLFFPERYNIYSFQGGVISDTFGDYVRTEVQNKNHGDIVLVSTKPVARLSDFEDDSGAVFVNTATLRYALDIAPLPPGAFLRTALRRGLRVKRLNPDAAL